MIDHIDWDSRSQTYRVTGATGWQCDITQEALDAAREKAAAHLYRYGAGSLVGLSMDKCREMVGIR